MGGFLVPRLDLTDEEAMKLGYFSFLSLAL